jgi:hypothetical protein
VGERETHLKVILPPALLQSVDSLPIGVVGAAILGALIIVAGFSVQRGGQLRTRQGAGVLASFATVVGVVVVGCAAMILLDSAWQMLAG